MNSYKKRSWIEINLDALSNNMKRIKKLLGKEEPIVIVKADAYGCGASMVCRFLSMKFKINYWGVASLEEAIKLRQDKIDGEILILGYTPPDQTQELIRWNITPSIICDEHAKIISEKVVKMGEELPVHLAVDTGMSRIGFTPEECADGKIKYEGLQIAGIFTHLCHADSLEKGAKDFTDKQIEIFKKASKGYPNPHCKNSASIVRGIGEGFTFSRPGIILYGLKSSEEVYDEEVIPIMSWKACVSMVKTVPKGTNVGYGRTFITEKETKIATIPVGYADGYSRELSNCGTVLINGKRVPVIGSICMDQFMIDVTGLDVKMGDIATLFGKDGEEIYTADDMAEDIGTIGYHVVCMVSKRVPRSYLFKRKVVNFENWI